MTDAIHVVLRPRVIGSGLWPRYDGDAGIIEVASDVPREWPYGVNVGASVVFDLDAARVLANFDVLLPKKRWRQRPDPGKPHAAREVELVFSSETLHSKSLSLPVVVSSDGARRHAVVAFHEHATEAMAAALSERCFAYVDGESLLGFYLDLAE